MIQLKVRNRYMRKAYGFARVGNVTMAQACFDMARRAFKVTIRQQAVLVSMVDGIKLKGGFDPAYAGTRVSL